MLLEAVSRSRRARLEIIANILDVCRGSGAKKTHLMYRCNMSFVQIKAYLNLILKAKLIRVQNDGVNVYFRISGKGRRFLKSYQSLKALME